MNPADLKYSSGHTWVNVDGDVATIGLSDYAQEQLGSVLFIEVKEAGDAVTQSEPCGSVESDKATSDIVAPVSGEVSEVNDEVLNAPEVVNDDPYGQGWLIKIKLSNPSELDALMNAEQFAEFIASSE